MPNFKGKFINWFVGPSLIRQVRNFDHVQIHKLHLLEITSEWSPSLLSWEWTMTYALGPKSHKTYQYTAKDHTLQVVRTVYDSLWHDFYPLHGTLKNLRMLACCYQLKLARKAERLSLWQKAPSHVSAQRIVVFFFSRFFFFFLDNWQPKTLKHW